MLHYVKVPIIFCQINLKTPRAALSETNIENDLLLIVKKSELHQTHFRKLGKPGFTLTADMNMISVEKKTN